MSVKFVELFAHSLCVSTNGGRYIESLLSLDKCEVTCKKTNNRFVLFNSMIIIINCISRCRVFKKQTNKKIYSYCALKLDITKT